MPGGSKRFAASIAPQDMLLRNATHSRPPCSFHKFYPFIGLALPFWELFVFQMQRPRSDGGPDDIALAHVVCRVDAGIGTAARLTMDGCLTGHRSVLPQRVVG